LLPVGDKPLVAYTLELLARHGLRDVTINLHYRPRQFRDALGDGSDFGVRIEYCEEPEPLGTAGTVAALAAHDRDVEDFLVIYGDLIFDHDLLSLIRRHRNEAADATLLLHRRHAPSQSVVTLNDTGWVSHFAERPRHQVEGQLVWVSSGCQVVSRELVTRFPDRRPLDLPRDVYAPMAPELRILGVPIDGHRVAVDSPERYRAAIADVEAGRFGR
jgi:mannose-1-phosphate guanylyltransferase/phosphomannomutase